MAVVPGVLLDHVGVNPPQVPFGPPLGPVNEALVESMAALVLGHVPDQP